MNYDTVEPEKSRQETPEEMYSSYTLSLGSELYDLAATTINRLAEEKKLSLAMKRQIMYSYGHLAEWAFFHEKEDLWLARAQWEHVLTIDRYRDKRASLPTAKRQIRYLIDCGLLKPNKKQEAYQLVYRRFRRHEVVRAFMSMIYQLREHLKEQNICPSWNRKLDP